MSNRIAFSHPQHYRVFLPGTFEKLGKDFGMVVKTELVRSKPSIKSFLGCMFFVRNIIPGIIMESFGLPAAYDYINFRMIRDL